MIVLMLIGWWILISIRIVPIVVWSMWIALMSRISIPLVVSVRVCRLMVRIIHITWILVVMLIGIIRRIVGCWLCNFIVTRSRVG